MPRYNNWAIGWQPLYGPGEIIPIQAQNFQDLCNQVAVASTPSNEEGTMINDFKVGCDPEFMLVDRVKGTPVVASQYFPYHGEIGYDHNGRIAEFRPAPTQGILPIIRKIKQLVGQASEKVSTAKFRAGAVCNADCLGGHIHFGFPAFEKNLQPAGPYNVIGTVYGHELLPKAKAVTEALDKLTKTLEHLDILPKAESVARRVNGQGGHYGSYGDVRDCHGHMEYRTMASWLYDPKVAFLCLTAAKLAAADPAGAKAALSEPEWKNLKNWMETYVSKDVNAARASEKLLDKGLASLQVDPDVDFRERWRTLGIL